MKSVYIYIYIYICIYTLESACAPRAHLVLFSETHLFSPCPHIPKPQQHTYAHAARPPKSQELIDQQLLRSKKQLPSICISDSHAGLTVFRVTGTSPAQYANTSNGSPKALFIARPICFYRSGQASDMVALPYPGPLALASARAQDLPKSRKVKDKQFL